MTLLFHALDTADAGQERGYDSVMTQVHAPWQQPAAPASGTRKWIPAAIIAAGIVIAGGVIGGAVLLNGHQSVTERAATGTPGVDATASGIGTPTCEAWLTTKAALNAIPPLPNGWDWNTPHIDVYIANAGASAEKALNLFEPQIAPEPANVAAAAHAYVDAKRASIEKLSAHTYTAEEAAAGNVALAKLDQICGTP